MAAGAQTVPFTQSADGRYAIFAPVEDVTPTGQGRHGQDRAEGLALEGPANARSPSSSTRTFQCPFCSRGYNTMEKQVLAQYGDKVRFYYKPLPPAPSIRGPSGRDRGECPKQQKPRRTEGLRGPVRAPGRDQRRHVKAKRPSTCSGTGADVTAWNDCFDNKSRSRSEGPVAEGSSVGVAARLGFIITGVSCRARSPRAVQKHHRREARVGEVTRVRRRASSTDARPGPPAPEHDRPARVPRAAICAPLQRTTKAARVAARGHEQLERRAATGLVAQAERVRRRVDGVLENGPGTACA